jgi:RCC1 and BTB domain-containing protein
MPEEQGTELYTWGQGVLGQLGHGDEKPQNQPRLIVSFLGTNVKAVSCGNQHTAVLLESGEVYSFGRGNFGQLGLGSLQAANVSNPTVVEGLQGKYITAIACGWHHTAALTDSGQLYTWGSGEYGRLGHGDESRQNAPKVVEGLSGKSISFIACGGFHTAAITDRGALYTWGGGYFGQLGQGDEADKKMPRSVKGLRDKVMKQVACGTHHTLALSENSEVFAWGAGEYGKLGIGDEEKHTSPVLVEELQGKGVRAVACGGFHSVALSDTGSVYCWGGGDKGQLGLGNDKSQTLPCVVDALQVSPRPPAQHHRAKP